VQVVCTAISMNTAVLYGVGNVSFTALPTSDWNYYTLCKGIQI